jgi:hypothetical protein
VQDKRVGGLHPPSRGQGGAELLFDAFGFIGVRDTEPVRHAENMSINRHAGNAKRMPEDDVGRLAADTGKPDEGFHIRWHIARVAFQ